MRIKIHTETLAAALVFERRQLHAGETGTREDFFGSGIDLVEVRRTDETLKQCDVRTVRLIQGESIRKDLEQPSVVGLGVTHHRGVRFQQNVDGRNWALRILCRHKRSPLWVYEAVGKMTFQSRFMLTTVIP